jgi:hypothetical protein
VILSADTTTVRPWLSPTMREGCRLLTLCSMFLEQDARSVAVTLMRWTKRPVWSLGSLVC